MLNYHDLAEFTWGDPHFKTVDNQTFTFNGIGEYILLRTVPSLGFSLQARLEPFSDNTTGTIISAVVVRQGDVQAVQIVSENNQMNLYIAGMQYELTASDSPLIVDASGVVSSDLSQGITSTQDPIAMATTANQLTVRMDDSGSIIVSTADGASLSVSYQTGFLVISVSLPQSFSGDLTSGLLGVFNGNSSDDYRNRAGNVLTPANEAEIYQFGLECKFME